MVEAPRPRTPEQSQPEWLKLYVSGLTNPGTWYVVMENEVAAVIAKPGTKCWRGGRSVYAQSTQWLVHKGVTYSNDHRRTVWHGHTGNAKRELMREMMDAREAS